eukprot:COSAG01_NODE_34761_length_542_cov_1.869074_2_plen_68_part_01
MYFGPLRPLFYFNSPDGSLVRLAGRLASPDCGPGRGQPLHACISDPHTDPCMSRHAILIQSDLLTETA